MGLNFVPNIQQVDLIAQQTCPAPPKSKEEEEPWLFAPGSASGMCSTDVCHKYIKENSFGIFF
jgi:hypothetical protein